MRTLSDIKPDDTILTEHAGVRRAAACRAFWSDHPLNLAFRQQHGDTFSLREFTAFVIAMPASRFLSLLNGGEGER